MPDENIAQPKDLLRWFHPTPGRVLVKLLAVEGILFLCDWFRWTPKGWAVLMTIAVVAVTIVMMLLWLAFALVFHWRFQISIRSLLVLTVAVAVPFSWLAVKINQARRQRFIIEAIVKEGGFVNYDWQFANGRKEPPGPSWLRNFLGEDLFSDVQWVKVTSDAGLANVKDFRKLHALSLFGNQVTDEGLKQLEGLSQLQMLNLSGMKITSRGFMQIKGLTELQSLYAINTPIADSDLEQLKTLMNLHILFLDRTQVTDTGLEHLKGLTRLQVLYLRNTKVSEVGVAELQKVLPDCEIEH